MLVPAPEDTFMDQESIYRRGTCLTHGVSLDMELNRHTAGNTEKVVLVS